MTIDYNDGKWHGWNGGDCPVHPMTEVEAVWMHRDGTVALRSGKACVFRLDGNEHGCFVALRVTKVHREPREFWIVGGSEAWGNKRDAVNAALSLPPTSEIIHVREVLEP